MIVWLSRKLAGAMVGAGTASEENREVYEYGLEVLLSTAASVVFVLLAGALIGKLLETIAFLALFITLRSTAGGFHASTHFRCFLIMMAAYAAAMALVMAVPADVSGWVAMAVSFVSAAVVAMFAPAPHENRPVGEEELRKFRVVSLWIASAEGLAVVLFAVIGWCAIALAGAMGMAASAVSLVVAHAAGRKGLSA